MTVKNKIKLVFMLILVAEILLVSILDYKININLKDGFSVKLSKNHSTLQDKITEDFQIDAYVASAAYVKPYEINNWQDFFKYLKDRSNPVAVSVYDNLSDVARKVVNDAPEEPGEHQLSALDMSLQNIILSCDLYGGSLNLCKSDETDFLKSQYAENKLTDTERMRLNRLCLETAFPAEVLSCQHAVPEIKPFWFVPANYKTYLFSKNIFGEKSAIGTFNLLKMLFVTDIVLLLIAWFVRKSLQGKPSKSQVLFEMVYTFFEDLVVETLGKERKHFTPYIATLFIFIWTCNMIGMIPVPGFMEPTRNLNVPLGLGILAIVIVHIVAFKAKGFWGHLQGYVNPIKNPLFVLDLVGEVSKMVSISFRLFGNILGGAIIILVVSSLVKFMIIPVALNGFFGIFVGTVQAFVFTMLALTYIAVEVSE
ncbi:MAG: ATP synthase F0 subunit A [Candidatus Cloacimonadota bacterium]|nr:MAG: ATP synthase F0 subunit A [Candidatus Cloacimonadota bacterium]